jgi:AraC family transcriptional regulator of adaptative response/methylated-DNA-[protein]-cysteine methyltransferase
VIAAALPSRRELLRAFNNRDQSYEGVFVTAVRTTGIFCRPTCPARRPKAENIDFFATSRDALAAGYRPCKRCVPLTPMGQAPTWLAPLLDAVDREPSRRWRDGDLRRLGLSPSRIARWFKSNHGMTFHAYSRLRRLGGALRHIQGGTQVTIAAGDVGYESLSAFNEAFLKFAGEPPTRASGRTVVHVTRVESPVGQLVLGVTNTELVLLEFVDRRMLPTQIARVAKALKCVFAPGETALLRRVRTQLDEYFSGRRQAFDLPIGMTGTPFQVSVWNALLEIPSGATRSYKEVAQAIGRPEAVRAVARANGDNRMAIVIPCHRVIGADGKLVGYGGGLWRKQRLLDLERGVTSLLSNQ